MNSLASLVDLTNSEFAQQKLPAWRPILMPKLSLIILFVLSIFSFFFGTIFLIYDSKVIEFEKRYDDICEFGKDCKILFHISEQMTGNIYLRYKLTNFYQNHRRFMESRSKEQLNGQYVDFDGMSKCKPYRSINDSTLPQNWYLPCGLSAISFFNDTYDFDNNLYEFIDKNISWESDRKYLFNTLSSEYTTGYKWLESYTDFSGSQKNEHFINWMRVSALSTIIKEYSICLNCNLPIGYYNITIHNHYPNNLFSGNKFLILTTKSPLGAKNNFIGISYIFLGILSFLLSIGLLLNEIYNHRELGDLELIKKLINDKETINLNL